MRQLLGEEADDLELSLTKAPSTGLRVNGLKLSPAEFERLSPWPLEPVPWCPAGYTLDPHERPGIHPYHGAGLYYLQEPSAMAPAQALAPRPGEMVLDLAAAPGGKSTQLASMLGDRGLLVANDVHPGRARELSRNMERWGSKRSLVTSMEPGELASAWGALFDAVLLDAPCSGEGMFRKTPQAREQWTPGLVESCALRQAGLLEEAARLVKPGGRLAYSTCTFEPLENERVVAGFLDAHDDWQMLPTGLEGPDAGVPEWAAQFARSRELSLASRIWPHNSSGEGHFVALLQRSTEHPAGARGGRGRRRPDKGSGAELQHAIDAWHGFVSENLKGNPVPEHEILLRSDGSYALPPFAPGLERLRVLRPGLWLGKSDRGRFVPSHALALALRGEEAEMTVDLDPDDGRLAAYLMGAELETPGRDGWLLVTVSGHPIGWGRRARGIVKNHYPKGLRRQPGG